MIGCRYISGGGIHTKYLENEGTEEKNHYKGEIVTTQISIAKFYCIICWIITGIRVFQVCAHLPPPKIPDRTRYK